MAVQPLAILLLLLGAAPLRAEGPSSLGLAFQTGAAVESMQAAADPAQAPLVRRIRAVQGRAFPGDRAALEKEIRSLCDVLRIDDSKRDAVVALYTGGGAAGGGAGGADERARAQDLLSRTKGGMKGPNAALGRVFDLKQAQSLAPGGGAADGTLAAGNGGRNWTAGDYKRANELEQLASSQFAPKTPPAPPPVKAQPREPTLWEKTKQAWDNIPSYSDWRQSMATPSSFIGGRSGELADKLWKKADELVAKGAYANEASDRAMYNAVYNGYGQMWPDAKKMFAAWQFLVEHRAYGAKKGTLNDVLGTDYTPEEIAMVDHFYQSSVIGVLGGPLLGGVMGHGAGVAYDGILDPGRKNYSYLQGQMKNGQSFGNAAQSMATTAVERNAHDLSEVAADSKGTMFGQALFFR